RRGLLLAWAAHGSPVSWAEREYSTPTVEPDLDHASAGSDQPHLLGLGQPALRAKNGKGTMTNQFTAEPLRFGVGARVGVAVMSDDFAEVILGALRDVDPRGLTISTGDVSTWAGGSEEDLLGWLTDLRAAVAATGHHAAITVQLSRGCPGEVACELPGGAGPRVVEAPRGRDVGTWAAAEWAIYPLA